MMEGKAFTKQTDEGSYKTNTDSPPVDCPATRSKSARLARESRVIAFVLHGCFDELKDGEASRSASR